MNANTTFQVDDCETNFKHSEQLMFFPHMGLNTLLQIESLHTYNLNFSFSLNENLEK